LTSKPNEEISIYIHWPYCKSLCPYCDFNSHIAISIDPQIWVNAYIKDLENFEEYFTNKKIKSIFFGGGTPSLMDPWITSGVIDYISGRYDISEAEITLEANPTSSDEKKFLDFKNSGINRLSIGVQSFEDVDLKILGREHSSHEAKNVIESAAKIFSNFSFDLIYARPNQNLKKWEDELEFALSLGSKHISLYQLTIEKGTPFYKLHKDGKLNIPDEFLAGELFDLTHNILSKNQFARYEISNYSREGFECRHNLVYWHYDDFIGIGPGAHSRVDCTEFIKFHMPDKWLKEIYQPSKANQKSKKIDKKTMAVEMAMMGLRTASGISEENLYKKTQMKFIDAFDINLLEKLASDDFLRLSNNKIVLSDNGLNLHSYILSRILKL
jgi:putative oxygen-independent coproporphyrinogen III oxidase